jgi:replication factor C subunit 3/5
MSDYEDEMDVDAPVADTAISFGGDQKKGKRTAANLPVEAEDSLPWYVAAIAFVDNVTNQPH